MIKNVIFDIGMVLIDWHPVLGNVFDAGTAAVVEHAIFGSGLWDWLDHGIEEDEKVFDKMVALAPDYEEQIRYVLGHLYHVSEQFDYAGPWIHELKEQGYHVYYLSNYSRHLRKMEPGLTDFVPLMEGGIFSSDVKLMKPDHKIYELLCATYQLTPGECLFIDDRQVNVDAAVDCGMKAVCFEGYANSYQTIMEMLQEDK